MREWSIALSLLLGGCAAAAGGWSKPGADAATTAGDYQECRSLAASAVKTQAEIDQDILATRQSDWQRAGIARVDARNRQAETGDRAAAIIASCMRAKGFAPTAKTPG
jgi:hypothetical protein